MRKDARDDSRIFNTGQHLWQPTAAGAAADLDPEHPLQALRPAHRHVAWRGGLLGALRAALARTLAALFAQKLCTRQSPKRRKLFRARSLVKYLWQCNCSDANAKVSESL